MKFTVEIGNDEKHTVFFHFNKFWGNLEILVNNKKIVSDFRTISFELVKAYEFQVGLNELHHVRIEKIRPLFLAGFRSNDYKVYVDGNLYREFND